MCLHMCHPPPTTDSRPLASPPTHTTPTHPPTLPHTPPPQKPHLPLTTMFRKTVLALLAVAGMASGESRVDIQSLIP